MQLDSSHVSIPQTGPVAPTAPTVQITAVRMLAGAPTEHITHIADLWWHVPGTEVQGFCTRQQLVDYLDAGKEAFVNINANGVDAAPEHTVAVTPCHPAGHEPYVRTAPDDIEQDNLLQLPRF